MKRKAIIVVWLVAIVVLGCSPNMILRDAMDEATDEIGREITDRVVSAYLEDIGPSLIRSYTIGLMQLMFYQGGYYHQDQAYEPGEYTIWTSEESPYGQTMERAFLQRRDDGWEWWRLEIFGEDSDSDDDFHMIIEALFEPQDDKRIIRQMFVQYPDADEPEEVEIDDEDSEDWIVRAESWSDEDLEQAFMGSEQVTVPAGTFTADHYEIESEEDDDYRTQWWITDGAVPGSVVKVHQYDESNSDDSFDLVLESYGDGATRSALGAF